jgi:hypothetical protein
MKSYATREFAEQWLYLLGGLFIVVTLFMPKGIVGLPEQFRQLKKKFNNRHGAPEPTPATAVADSPASEKSLTP